VVAAAFLGSLLLVETRGWINLNAQVAWGLYLSGVLVAMVWIQHSLRGSREKLGALGLREAVWLTAQQVVRLMVVLFTLAFVMKDVGISRLFLVGFIGLASAILFAANYFLARFLANAFFHRRRLRTVIVAPAAEARLLQSWLAPRRYLGIETLGYVTLDPETGGEDLQCLGTVADMAEIIARDRVHQVVVSQSDSRRPGMADLVWAAEQTHCRVRFFVNMQSVFGVDSNRIEHNGNFAFASTMEPLENPFNRVLKRALDIAVALPVVFFVLPPLTALVWFMQRLQSPGAVFYRQQRSGLDRKRFHIYKFRTMHEDSGNVSARQASSRDSRVYAFGRFLRRTSLDEVPQFLNVILGEMSVSGPRPHLIEHDEQFGRLEHAYFKRHFVKPGITGLAQSRGFRGELLASGDLAGRVHYDELYVANWSLGLDLSILLRTVRQVVTPPPTAY
jgi:exopolysaccharide biosynthesis polyprenyl glycosylphosphotransferase